jgi:hypothetical protein
MKIFKILQGVWNFLFKKIKVEIESQRRMEICEVCESIDYTGKDCLVPGTQPCCKECGCSLKLKTRSSDTCPKGKW